MTKLCDVGIDDSVCSVGWAQRGTHLAVGTNNGKVQVINACFNLIFLFPFKTFMSNFDLMTIYRFILHNSIHIIDM